MGKAEQVAYRMGKNGTKLELYAQLKKACRGFYQQVWAEALSAAKVSPSSELRNLERIGFPPTLRTKDVCSSTLMTGLSTLALRPPTQGGQRGVRSRRRLRNRG
nr:hypothetical protein CFP56_41207 [Quercus suber]